MGKITLKYAATDSKTGRWMYRRRVPVAVKHHFDKTELIKALGGTEAEAVKNWPSVHQHFERLIKLAKSGVSGMTLSEQRAALISQLQEWGMDAYSAGADDNERTARDAIASRMVEGYQDISGNYIDVPEGLGATAGALFSGFPSSTTPPLPTVRDAFKGYLEENAKADPHERKKQTQRLTRVELAVVSILKRDCLVSAVTRSDARAWREARGNSGVALATVRRELNDIRAVFNFAIRELDAGGENPFAGLSLKNVLKGEVQTAQRDTRLPLPQAVIDGVYTALRKGTSPKRRQLLAIWTLLDWTGARPAEIRGLRREDIIIECDIPHIHITPHSARTLKNPNSARRVPLVGSALEAAKDIHRGPPSLEVFAFPNYITAKAMDRLSAALKRPIRKLSDETRHVPYSLRHNMKDRLRAAQVYESTQDAILGHKGGSGISSNYGGPASLEALRDGLQKAMGHPD